MEEAEAARQNAEGQSARAVDYNARSFTLADELRKAIGERFQDSPIVQDTAAVRSNFLSAGPQARSEVADLVNSGTILSPNQQQAILGEKRSSALVPLMGQNLMQQAAFGSLDDLISAGTRAFQAQSAQEQGLASLAESSYKNILNEILQQAQLDQQEQKRLQEEEMFPLDKLLKQAQIDAANRSNVNQPTASDEKQELIRQASMLPETQRKAYILANGYNPNDTDFSGLFTAPSGIDTSAAGALEKTGQIKDYVVDPLSGRLVPKSTTSNKGTAKFFPDMFGFAPFGRY
jgi:hypothetical protein